MEWFDGDAYDRWKTTEPDEPEPEPEIEDDPDRADEPADDDRDFQDVPNGW